MFDYVLNTYTPEVDNKDTKTWYFVSFMCFYCWLWTNLVHCFSCIFDIFRKLTFPLFWTSKHHLGKVLKIEKNRWHNTLPKCSRRKRFGIKNVLQITEMIQEQNIVQCKIRSARAINDKDEFKILHFLLSKTLGKFWNGSLSVTGEERGAEGGILADKSCWEI